MLPDKSFKVIDFTEWICPRGVTGGDLSAIYQKDVRPLKALRNVSGCPDADWCLALQRICAKASLKDAISVCMDRICKSLGTYIKK